VKRELVIINNEKCIKKDGDFYCENLEIKSISELLSEKFKIKLILRNSNINPVHKIEKSEVTASSNIFSFIFNIFKSLKKDNPIYLIISVTPYSFISFLIILLFKKKIFLYLRSDGKKEISVIFGKNISKIYKIVENFMAKFSDLIVVNRLISDKKEFHLVNPSQIDQDWFINLKQSKRSNIKLFYVGRLKIEKGVYSLLNIIDKIQQRKNNVYLTLVGQGNHHFKTNDNIKFLNPISNKKDLIKQYDEHDIFILPSFTEGHPQVILESLARKKPVIVFEEIKHVVEQYNGIFVTKRNDIQLEKTIDYINKNYDKILDSMSSNILPSKKNFFNQLDKILN